MRRQLRINGTFSSCLTYNYEPAKRHVARNSAFHIALNSIRENDLTRKCRFKYGLKRLKQAAAAHLLGVGARSLRDRHGVPRNSDGSYDARELVRYATRSIEPRKLSDDLEERLLKLEDIFVEEYEGLLRLFQDFDSEFGDAGLALIARKLMAVFEEACSYPANDACLSNNDHELLTWAREKRREERRRRSMARLEYRVVCEGCEKVRFGPRWREEKLAANVATLLSLCPKCEAA